MRYFLLLILIVIDVFADTDTVNLSRVYDSASQDTSIWYLGKIFGSVFEQGVLVDDTIITNSVKIFNAGLIAFIGGTVATTIGVSTINTAREGVFMGRMLPTAWYPLRVVIGTSFLAPTINGYSGLQVLILWLAMQGANLANNLWTYTTEFVNKNGGAFTTNVVFQGNDSTTKLTLQNYKKALRIGANIIQAQSCVIYNNNKFNDVARTLGVSPNELGSTPGFKWVIEDNVNKSYQSVLPENQGSISGYIDCGRFDLPAKPPTECFLGDEKKCDAEYLKYNEKMRLNFDTFYENLNNNTKTIVSQCNYQNNCMLDTYSDQSMNCSVDDCSGLKGLEAAARIFAIESKSALDSYLLNVGKVTKVSADVDFGSGGWISAGNFYDKLSSLKSVPDTASYSIQMVNFNQQSPTKKPTNALKNDFSIYLYLDKYLQGGLKQSKNIVELAENNFKTQRIKNASTFESDNKSLDSVRQKMYIALVNIMPKYCKSNQNNADEVGLCSTKSVTENNTILNLLTSSNKNDFNRGVELYHEKNQSLIEANPTLTKENFICSFPIGNIVGSLVSGCDNSAFAWMPRPIIGFFSGDWGLDWGVFGSDFGPNVFEEVLGQNVQVYIYNVGKAWLDVFTNEDKNSFPNLNVIYDISQFGRQLVQHNFDFLTATVNTVYTIQYNADMFYLTQTFLSGMVTQVAQKAAALSGKAAQAFMKIFYTAGPFGFWAIVPGLLMSALAGVGAGAVVGVLSYIKAKLPVDQQLFNWRTTAYIPVVTAATVPLIALGMMLWLFLPMLPFLVYLFTVIGWFISIIEAVVAGPLIAAGITNPQGHEFLGKSEQSLMLMVSVVIRPALILISFMFAIILTYVGVKLTTNLMMVVMSEIMNRLDTGYLGAYFAILFLSYLFVYTMFQVVNYTFSVVYEVPAKIMRWIGTPKEDSVGSAIAAIKGEVNQMFGKFGESGKKVQGAAQGAGR